MTQGYRLGLTFLLAGILSACQPPPPYVIAVIEAGSIVFHVRERGMIADRIFGWDDDRVNIRQLAISSGDGIFWRYRRDGSSGGCKVRETFPVRLGEKRCGYRTQGDMAAVKPKQIYEIRLNAPDCTADTCRNRQEWWSGDVVGRFRVDDSRHVVNFRPD